MDEFVIQLELEGAGSEADRVPLILSYRAHFGHWVVLWNGGHGLDYAS